MEPTTFTAMPEMACDNCGKIFKTMDSDVWSDVIHECKFCSPECLLEYLGESGEPTLELTCVNCGELIDDDVGVWYDISNEYKCCSPECLLGCIGEDEDPMSLKEYIEMKMGD
jgi:hypothetical protein